MESNLFIYSFFKIYIFNDINVQTKNQRGNSNPIKIIAWYSLEMKHDRVKYKAIFKPFLTWTLKQGCFS